MRYVEDLKFRLWSTERNHWLAVGMTIIDFQQDASQSLQLPILTSEGGVIVQQFTGFLDSNGVEIYEGDTIEYEYPEYTTYYQSGNYIFNTIVTFDKGVFWADIPLYEISHMCKVTVTGNIFENKQ